MNIFLKEPVGISNIVSFPFSDMLNCSLTSGFLTLVFVLSFYISLTLSNLFLDSSMNTVFNDKRTKRNFDVTHSRKNEEK